MELITWWKTVLLILLGRFWNYAVREGMRVPLHGEAAWLLPEGEKPYWRGRVISATYEFAR